MLNFFKQKLLLKAWNIVPWKRNGSLYNEVALHFLVKNQQEPKYFEVTQTNDQDGIV